MKRIQKKLKGMSLLEVMVSMGIFSLMIVTIAGIFGSSISSSRTNRVIERNLEQAQFVMNEMAKELRTSTVLSPTGDFATPGVSASIRFYDYSQSLCINYQSTPVDDGTRHTIVRTSASVGSPDLCIASAPVNPQTMTIGDVVPSFRVVTSFDGGGNSALARVGRVTMVFVVKEKALATQSVTLQTSVSLRDYMKSGILR